MIWIDLDPQTHTGQIDLDQNSPRAQNGWNQQHLNGRGLQGIRELLRQHLVAR